MTKFDLFRLKISFAESAKICKEGSQICVNIYYRKYYFNSDSYSYPSTKSVQPFWSAQASLSGLGIGYLWVGRGIEHLINKCFAVCRSVKVSKWQLNMNKSQSEEWNVKSFTCEKDFHLQFHLGRDRIVPHPKAQICSAYLVT